MSCTAKEKKSPGFNELVKRKKEEKITKKRSNPSVVESESKKAEPSFECIFCYNPPKPIVCLDCCHVFCDGCLMDYFFFKQEFQADNIMICPICKTTTENFIAGGFN